MKKTLAISLIGFLLVGFTELTKGQNITNRQKLKIENEVGTHFHSMVKAAEALDYDRISKGVDDRYQAGFIANDSYFMRYDSLINIVKARTQGAARQTITIQKEKITVLSDNIVLLTAFGNASIDLNSGKSFSVKFMWSFVYKKIDGNWSVIQSHQSNIR